MQFKIKSQNLFFFTAWSMFLIYILLFNESEIGYLFNNGVIKLVIMALVFVLLGIKIFSCDKYPPMKLLTIAIITIFVACVSYISKNSNLLLYELLLIGSKDIDFKKLIKLDMIIRIICIIILFLLSKNGLINNYTAVINGNLKQAFGWLHPNTFGAIFSIVILEFIYLNWNKLSILKVAAALVLIMIVYELSASRTNVYVITFTVLFSYMMKKFKAVRDNKIVDKICTYIYPLLAIISFIVVFLYRYNTDIGNFLNKVMTGRLYLSNLFLNQYGFSILGQPLEIVTTRQAILTGLTPIVLDMAYIRLFIQYGIIYFVFFLILNTILQKKLLKEKKYSEMMLVIYFAIIGLAENTPLNLYMNFTLMLLFQSRKEGVSFEK